MKKLISLLIIYTLFTHTAWAMTYANEAKDFQGLAWGSTQAQATKHGWQLTSVSHNAEEQVTVYNLRGQNLNLYGKNFDNITYHFYRNCFYLVRAVKNKEQQMSSGLYQSLKSQHGPHTQNKTNFAQKTDTFWWQGDNTTITLVYDYKKQQTILTFYNHRLQLEQSLQTTNTAKKSSKIKQRS